MYLGCGKFYRESLKYASACAILVSEGRAERVGAGLRRVRHDMSMESGMSMVGPAQVSS